MKSIGIFYGSSTGNTQDAAERIAKKININQSNLFDVGNVSVDKLQEYDVLFLGSSTWGMGDLQDDWEEFILQLSKQDLSGKVVAVFGTGDSSSYSDTFCDALGIIAQAASKAGAKVVGSVDALAYSYDDSQSVKDGKFCGLALDTDNENDLTDGRINDWIEQIKLEIQ